MLSEMDDFNYSNIKSVISKESFNWCIMVTGVEIRPVIIPQELVSAMSMQAQDER